MYAHKMYTTIIKGPKKIWVPKVEKSNYDPGVLDNLKSKDDTDNCFSSHTIEEINMFSYFASTKREIVW